MRIHLSAALLLTLVMLGTGLFACSVPEDGRANFTITVSGSTSPRPLTFSGTYQFALDGARVTRDLSGEGSFAASFEADRLVYVRVIATTREGIYSLAIRRDGELLYESPATAATVPLLYSSE